MAESAPEMSGPSLEDILWRNADRYARSPAVVDSDAVAEREGFVEHLSQIYAGDLPAQDFVDHFFGTGAKMLSDSPADMAEAVVRATKQRMQVFQFDLDRFEYVVLEEEDKVVVVSDFGQFAIDTDDTTRAALERAVLPALDDAQRKESGTEPRAYFVRRDGTMAAMDVPALAKALNSLQLKQVEAPAIKLPQSRLWAFDPVKKTLDIEREVEIIRAERKAQQRRPLPPPPPALFAGSPAKSPREPLEKPPNADTTVMLILADGSLARPAIGAPSRWRELISDWLMRSTALSMGAGKAMAASGEQRFAVDSGKVVALFSSSRSAGSSQAGLPGQLGLRALSQGDGISMARGSGAPVRVLGDDELSMAIARGAVIVPGYAAIMEDADGVPGDRFWIQPEAYFAPTPEQRQAARGTLDLAREGELVAGNGGEPRPRLGDITGDPWADWAMTTGGAIEPEGLLLAARDRDAGAMLSRSLKPGVLLAALARADASGGAIAMGQNGRELRLPGGAPVIAFTAPDGSLIVQRQVPTLRLAELGRPGADFDSSADDFFRPRAPIGSRSGSVPSSVLAALAMALERTAGAGSFRLPPLRIEAAADAVQAGAAMDLSASDPRRSSAMLMGSPSIYAGLSGQVARLLLSLPFPSRGEMHVGPDLSDALQAYLEAPAVPAQSFAGATSSTRVLGTAAASESGAFALRVSRPPGADGQPLRLSEIDWGDIHGTATQRARTALVTLQGPDVSSLVSRGPSVAGLPHLLARALEAGGDWVPGPGAPTPSAIRRFALGLPTEPVLPAPAASSEEGPRRPLSIGEDEIVIPMPLWAQMGRGRISATDQIMASRSAPADYAAPLGSYRLVMPRHAPYDFAGGAAGSPGVLQVAGPTRLDLVADPSRTSVAAHSAGGRLVLGNIALDEDDEPAQRRSRMRIGQSGGELGRDAPSGTLVATEQQRPQARAADESRHEGSADDEGRERNAEAARRAQTAQRDAAKQEEATEKAEAAHTAQAQSAQAPKGEPAAQHQPAGGHSAEGGQHADGEQSGRPRAGSLIDGQMTSALQGALRTSDEVAGRLSPMPEPGTSSLSAASRAPGMVVASPAHPAEPAKAAPASADDADSSSSSASSSSRRSAPRSNSPGAGSPLKLPASGAPAERSSSSSAASTIRSSSSPSRPVSSSELDRSAGEAARIASLPSRRSRGSGSSDEIRGLPRGAWSGHNRSDSGYTNWSYGSRLGVSNVSHGGISLAGLQRPAYPSLPTSLRFRYVSAPLWWTGSSRSGGASDAGGDEFESGSSSGSSSRGSFASQRALRAGLRAANSAATLWRSILVRGPSASSGGARGSSGDGELDYGDAGAMDRSWDSSAAQLSSLAGRFDALDATALATGSSQQRGEGAPALPSQGNAAGAMAMVASQTAATRAIGAGPQSLYVAVDQSGRAGLIDPKSAIQRDVRHSVQMSVVAAVPQSPPSLEAMADLSPAHTRLHHHHGGGGAAPMSAAADGGAPEASGGGGETVPTPASKIEGSVDAIAQRIYHRIRRRIASDRERFGG